MEAHPSRIWAVLPKSSARAASSHLGGSGQPPIDWRAPVNAGCACRSGFVRSSA
jgi:hypothetical protein